MEFILSNYKHGGVDALRSRWESTYGLTTGEVEEIYLMQNGKCKICGCEIGITDYGLCCFCIDHDHDTGKVRGLLCGKCNTQLHYVETVYKDLIRRKNYNVVKHFRYLIENERTRDEIHYTI